MIPYRRRGDIDYDALDFDPDLSAPSPDSMLQNREIDAVRGALQARLTNFYQRPDVFLDRESFICYDPSNLNVRVSPDVYVAVGVDSEAIRRRKLYLPWEVGKPPDWVLEIASESTAQADLDTKPGIYARIGVPEMFYFDPSGSEHYGFAIAGWRLENGGYHPIPITSEPDGLQKVYSEALGLSLCWDNGWPRLYDHSEEYYLEDLAQTAASRDEERAGRLVAEAGQIAAEAGRLAERERRIMERERRLAAEAENERLRETLRRLEQQED